MGNQSTRQQRKRDNQNTPHRKRDNPEQGRPHNNIRVNPHIAAGPAHPKPSSSKVPTGPQQFKGRILGKPLEDVRSHYTLGRELGRGQFGVTYICTHKQTLQKYACKSIATRKLKQNADVEKVRREVRIMQHLNGKPNIVEFKGAYEDRQSVNLVMELCAGGELFDRLIAKGHYSERAAASLFRTIAEVVHTCHSMGVIHRDLKPENFLFLSKDEGSPLKAIDFGLSIFFKPGDIFRGIVGSPYYVAPDVIRQHYGPEADIWSAGVILYILLSGVPPFWAEKECDLFNVILHGQINFEREPWPSISNGAKDLIKNMLKRDVKGRITSFQVLNHPWMREDNVATNKPLANDVLVRMKQFSEMNKIQKVALKVIAETLSEEEIMGLNEIFKSMDTDNSGTITFEELKNGLARLGSKASELEVRKLMDAVDVDGNGTIDYIEFITATMQKNKVYKEDHIHTAFQYFDKDSSGYITKEELEEALNNYGIDDQKNIKEIMAEVDINNDGLINYDEFSTMMRKGNPDNKRHDLIIGSARHRK